MSKSSFGDLFWIKNQCHGEHVLEKGQKRIFTTQCQYTVDSEKLFCLDVKSAKIHELPGALPSGTPNKALPWTH